MNRYFSKRRVLVGAALVCVLFVVWLVRLRARSQRFDLVTNGQAESDVRQLIGTQDDVFPTESLLCILGRSCGQTKLRNSAAVYKILGADDLYVVYGENGRVACAIRAEVSIY